MKTLGTRLNGFSTYQILILKMINEAIDQPLVEMLSINEFDELMGGILRIMFLCDRVSNRQIRNLYERQLKERGNAKKTTN